MSEWLELRPGEAQAFPERGREHPQSMGFQLQLEGWSDEDIAAKKWLSQA